ncbi:MAG: hypothetical protein Q7R60_02180 [bacterium]|nr:hypothetical protein [bacterium]
MSEQLGTQPTVNRQEKAARRLAVVVGWLSEAHSQLADSYIDEETERRIRAFHPVYKGTEGPIDEATFIAERAEVICVQEENKRLATLLHESTVQGSGLVPEPLIKNHQGSNDDGNPRTPVKFFGF